MSVYAVRREADRQLQAAASEYNRQRHALFSSELAMQVSAHVSALLVCTTSLHAMSRVSKTIPVSQRALYKAACFGLK
jgi:hypothetical protein